MSGIVLNSLAYIILKIALQDRYDYVIFCFLFFSRCSDKNQGDKICKVAKLGLSACYLSLSLSTFL